MTRYSKLDEERHGASSHDVLNKCSNIITSVPVTAMQNLVWKYVLHTNSVSYIQASAQPHQLDAPQRGTTIKSADTDNRLRIRIERTAVAIRTEQRGSRE